MFNFYSLTQPQFYLYGLYFLVIVLLLFIGPGLILTQKLRLKKAWTQITLAFVFGTSLWTIQALLFGFLQLRWLSYFYVLAALVLNCLFYKTIFAVFKKLWIEIKKTPKYLLLTLIIGVLIQLICISSSGLVNSLTGSVDYYFTNEADGLMHLSFIGGMVEQFPPLRPEIYPEPLTSYHYLSDLFQADLGRVFGLPINHLFFQYLPPLISLFTALALAFIIKFFTKKPTAVLFAWILLFLAADSGYLISLYLHHQFNWHVAAIDNGPEQFLNFPQTMAKLNFYVTIALLLRFWTAWKNKAQNKWALGFTAALIGAIIIGYKVYYGLALLAGLFLVTLGQIIIALVTTCKRKTPFANLWRQISGPCLVGLAVALPSLLIFFSNNSSTGGLGWYPLAWPNLLLDPNHLNDTAYTASLFANYDLGYWRGILTNIVWAVFTGLITIIGVRLIGLWPPNKKVYSNQSWEWLIFYYPVVIIFIFLGLNTLQAQGGFNTFNFFIVAINLLIIPLALNFTHWWPKNLFFKIFITLLILATLPRSFHNISANLQAYFQQKTDFSLSAAELELLQTARHTLPTSVLLQPHPKNEISWQKNAYLDFFTHRPVYLSSLNIIVSHGQPYQNREEQLQEIFLLPATEILPQLHQLGITHLYLQKKGEQQLLLDQIPADNIVLENAAGAFLQTSI